MGSDVLLVVMGMIAYILLMQMSTYKTKKKKALFVKWLSKEDKQKDTGLSRWLEKKGLRTFVSPRLMKEDAKKHGVLITSQSYGLTFLTGAFIGSIIMFVYFRPLLPLTPVMVILGGYMGLHLRLHTIKKRYIQQIDDKVMMYMSAFATAMGTFGNLKEAFASVLPLLDDPVKQDIEIAVLHLQDGKSVKQAFGTMNEKYRNHYLRLYHDQLDALVKSGSGDVTFLRKIAWKMKQKAVYRRKLQTAHREQFKVWRAFVWLSLSAPFLFMFVSTDHYKIVMSHLASSVVFIITFMMIGFTYRQLEKLELYDPTIHEQIQL